MVQIDYREIYGDWSYDKDIQVDLARTAVIVVDMQPAFSDPAYDFIKAYTELLPLNADYFDRRVKEVVRPNIARILTAARAAGVFVCYAVTYSETRDLSDMNPWMRAAIRKLEEACGHELYRKWSPGMAIYDDLKPEGDELVVVKKTGSAFVSSTLPMLLRNMEVDILLFTGCNTNGCVFSSAVVAHEMGWRTVLVGDATGCFTPEQQELFEQHIYPATYGTVMSTDEVVAALSADSARQ